MKSSFEILCGRLGVRYLPSIDSVLIRFYNSNARHYHGMRHILDCLSTFRHCGNISVCYEELEFAIWFHDLIYVPGRSDNELNSATIAKAMADCLGLPQCFGHRVERLIICTEYHIPDLTFPDTALMIDIDNNILGESKQEYDKYAEGIRKEFEPVVGHEAFIVGRKEWLTSKLKCDTIFHNSVQHLFNEQQARENMQRELDSLTL